MKDDTSVLLPAKVGFYNQAKQTICQTRVKQLLVINVWNFKQCLTLAPLNSSILICDIEDC